MKKVFTIIGTRPEAIKLAPILRELERRPDKFESKVVVTGQHQELLDPMLDLFEVNVDYDLSVMEANQGPSDVTARTLERIAPIFQREKPDWVLVQGDTVSVMAASLGAFFLRLSIGHVEAGLRTFDKYSPFPEELSRRIVGEIADLHFAPTSWAAYNLRREGIPIERIMITGNTVIDSLNAIVNRFDIAHAQLRSVPRDRKLILVTAHRRESFGPGMRQIACALSRLAALHKDIQIIYPLHLNPRSRAAVEILGGLPNVTLVDPLEYHELIWLLTRSYLVLTDSGGIQEEAAGFAKPTLVLRDTTERPEGVDAGIAKLVGPHCQEIVHEVERLLYDEEEYATLAHIACPSGRASAGCACSAIYGDGNAAKRIVSALEVASKSDGRYEVLSPEHEFDKVAIGDEPGAYERRRGERRRGERRRGERRRGERRSSDRDGNRARATARPESDSLAGVTSVKLPILEDTRGGRTNPSPPLQAIPREFVAQMFAAWLASNAVRSKCGAICAWKEIPSGKLAFEYPEITGYFLTWVASQDQPDRIEKEAAHDAAQWLITRVSAGDLSARSGWDSGAVYTFDLGMIAAGLISFGQRFGLNEAADVGTMVASRLAREIRQSGGLGAVSSSYHASQRRRTWSTAGQAHLLKCVQALLLAGFSKEARELMASASRLQRSNGSFCTQPDDTLVMLHPHHYAIEALWMWSAATGDDESLTQARHAAEWAWAYRLRNGGMPRFVREDGTIGPEQSDVTAQALRAVILTGAEVDGVDRTIARLEELAQPDGAGFALPYQPESPRVDLNAWATMFATQALDVATGAGLTWDRLV